MAGFGGDYRKDGGDTIPDVLAEQTASGVSLFQSRRFGYRNIESRVELVPPEVLDEEKLLPEDERTQREVEDPTGDRQADKLDPD